MGNHPGTRRPIRVVIADDDDNVRAALTDVLNADPRFTVVGAIADGTELPDLIRTVRADLVLLDVRMRAGGPGAARLVRAEARTAGSSPSVVAVSADTGTATVAAMLRAGVVGYLAKGQIGGALPELLVRCAGGEVVLAVPSGADALRDIVGASGE